MFGFKKRKEEKQQKNQAFLKAQEWKRNEKLQSCFAAMRGSFTVALAMNQEAADAVVSIAKAESRWTRAASVPTDFLSGECFVLWDQNDLPVLHGSSSLVLENLSAVTAVAVETWLVSHTFDRVVHVDRDGETWLYSVA